MISFQDPYISTLLGNLSLIFSINETGMADLYDFFDILHTFT